MLVMTTLFALQNHFTCNLTICLFLQFEDIRQFTNLNTIVFGGTIISNVNTVDCNSGSSWNYRSNFGGSTGSPTDHNLGHSSWGVADTAYSTYNASFGLTAMNNKITL